MFSIDVDDPISSAITNSAISALKNFCFRYFIHSLVVEFPPLVVLLVFDVIKVVTTICIALVDANSVKVVGVLFILNLPEDTVYVLVQLSFLRFQLLLFFVIFVLRNS